MLVSLFDLSQGRLARWTGHGTLGEAVVLDRTLFTISHLISDTVFNLLSIAYDSAVIQGQAIVIFDITERQVCLCLREHQNILHKFKQVLLILFERPELHISSDDTYVS